MKIFGQAQLFAAVDSSDSQPFMVCGPLLIIVINRVCNITVELFSKGLCSWPAENRPVATKGGDGSG